MMYLVSTDYEQFAFETKEDLNEFLSIAILPKYKVEEVKDDSMANRLLALDTEWKMAHIR